MWWYGSIRTIQTRKGKEVPIKFFCLQCGKEMWQGITEGAKQEDTTISKLEEQCICSDCIIDQVLLDIQKEREEEGG